MYHPLGFLVLTMLLLHTWWDGSSRIFAKTPRGKPCFDWSMFCKGDFFKSQKAHPWHVLHQSSSIHLLTEISLPFQANFPPLLRQPAKIWKRHILQKQY